MEKVQKVAEMWFLRSMLGINWTSHTSNVEVLRRAGCLQKLILTINNKKAATGILWSRNEKICLKDRFVTGKVEDTRDRCRHCGECHT